MLFLPTRFPEDPGIKPISSLGVRALDDRHIEYTLVGPIPFFNSLVLQNAYYPTPTHLFEKHGQAWSELSTFAGNGAYTIESVNSDGAVMLARNPFYRDFENIHYPRVKILGVGSDGEIQSLLGSGQMDISVVLENIDSAEWISGKSDLNVVYSDVVSLHFFMPNPRDEVLLDGRVRRALSLAIDREKVAKRLQTKGLQPAYGFASESKATNWQPPDSVGDMALALENRREIARALLAEAGYGPDNPLTLSVSIVNESMRTRIFNALASMWKAIGIQLEKVAIPQQQFSEKIYIKADYQATLLNYHAYFDDPYIFYSVLKSDTPPLSVIWPDDHYDNITAAMITTRDNADRHDLFAQAEKLIDETANAIPLIHNKYPIVHRSDISIGTFNFSRLVYSRHIKPAE